MSQRLFKLRVAQPCTEDWGAMTPTDKGRFCISCKNEVIDFSILSDEEIQNFFLKNNNPVCGRFRNQQLERIRIQLPVYFFEKKIPLWQKYLVVFLICFGSNLYSIDVNIGNTSSGLYAQSVSDVDSQQKTAKSLKLKRSRKNKLRFIPQEVKSIGVEFITLGFTISEQAIELPTLCGLKPDTLASINDSSLTAAGDFTNRHNNNNEEEKKDPKKAWEFILPAPIILRRRK